MKVCPVCKAQCFEDMDICYGCMYHFKSEKRDIPKGAVIDCRYVPQKKNLPRHAASGQIIKVDHQSSCGEEEFMAQFQIVLSIKPLTSSHVEVRPRLELVTD